jgi:hypothetical protein
MRPNIDHKHDVSIEVNAVPEAIARWQIILPNARQIAFEQFQLGGNALCWMMPKVCIDKALSLLGNVARNCPLRCHGAGAQNHQRVEAWWWLALAVAEEAPQ